MANSYPPTPSFGALPTLNFRGNIPLNTRRPPLPMKPSLHGAAAGPNSWANTLPQPNQTAQSQQGQPQPEDENEEGEICDDDDEEEAAGGAVQQTFTGYANTPMVNSSNQPYPVNIQHGFYGTSIHQPMPNLSAPPPVPTPNASTHPLDPPATPKSIPDMRMKARNAVMYLACTMKLSFQDILSEGIDEDVLRTVFEGLKLPCPPRDPGTTQTIKVVGKHQGGGILDVKQNTRSMSTEKDYSEFGPKASTSTPGVNAQTLVSLPTANIETGGSGTLKPVEDETMVHELEATTSHRGSLASAQQATSNAPVEAPSPMVADPNEGEKVNEPIQTVVVETSSTKPQEAREVPPRSRKRPVATDFDSGPAAYTTAPKLRKFGDMRASRDARLVIDVSDDESDVEDGTSTKLKNALEASQAAYLRPPPVQSNNKNGAGTGGSNASLTKAIRDHEKRIEDLQKIIQQKSKRQKDVSAANTPPILLSKPATPIPKLVSEATSRLIQSAESDDQAGLSPPDNQNNLGEILTSDSENENGNGRSPVQTGIDSTILEASSDQEQAEVEEGSVAMEASPVPYHPLEAASPRGIPGLGEVLVSESLPNAADQTSPTESLADIEDEGEAFRDDAIKDLDEEMQSDEIEEDAVALGDAENLAGSSTEAAPDFPKSPSESSADGASLSSLDETSMAVDDDSDMSIIGTTGPIDLSADGLLQTGEIPSESNSPDAASSVDGALEEVHPRKANLEEQTPSAPDEPSLEAQQSDSVRIQDEARTADAPAAHTDAASVAAMPSSTTPPRDDSPLNYYSLLATFKSFRYHPSFLDIVPGGFRSLTYSNFIDPEKPFCQYETQGGTCNDNQCPWQHFREIVIEDAKILLELAIPDGSTEEMQAQFKQGLHDEIINLTQSGVQDFETIVKKIVDFRRNSLGDPTRVIRNI